MIQECPGAPLCPVAIAPWCPSGAHCLCSPVAPGKGDRKAWLLHEHREAEACLEELTQRLEGMPHYTEEVLAALLCLVS